MDNGIGVVFVTARPSHLHKDTKSVFAKVGIDLRVDYCPRDINIIYQHIAGVWYRPPKTKSGSQHKLNTISLLMAENKVLFYCEDIVEQLLEVQEGLLRKSSQCDLPLFIPVEPRVWDNVERVIQEVVLCRVVGLPLS